MKRTYTLIALLLSSILSAHADNEILVGSMNVNSTVSESGGAVISIPIDVPAGIGGMQPNLSLVYNSQGGYGLAGWGWNLSGLSSITRTGSTMYHDSQIKGIDFSNSDNLQLDGNRLMLVSGTHFSSSAVYHTEAESFNKVTYVPSTSSFSVLSKEGLTSQYGNTPQSRWQDGNSAILSWNISRITDPNGNYVAYTYMNSSSPAETWLSRIDYTGNADTPPVWNIRFSYTDAHHPRVIWRDGKDFAVSKLLDMVSIYNDNVLLYHYKLEYDTSYVEPRLMQVQKIASNGDKYEPTTINWAQIGEGAFMSVGVSTSRMANVLYGDFNGDGRTDIFTYSNSTSYVVYINNSSNQSLNFQPYPLGSRYKLEDAQTGDYNGDGKMDVIGRYLSGGINRLVVLLSTGTGLNPIQICDMSSPAYAVGDFDGDGQSEIITGGSGGNNMMHGFSKTSHSVSGITLWSNTSGNVHTLSDSNVPLDFNGDGKTDLLLTSDTELKAFSYDEDAQNFNTILNTDWNTLGYSTGEAHHPYFGDFNGDGLTDIGCVKSVEHGSGNVEWQFRKFIFSGYLSLGQAQISTIPNYLVYTADVNCDGLTDVCNLWNTSNTYHISVGLNNGETFAFSQSSYNTNLNLSSLDKVSLIDLTNDGLPEFVDFDNTSIIYAKQICQRHPLLVHSVSDSYGNTFSYTYKPLTDSSIYVNNQTVPNKTLPLVGPLNVVSSYSAPHVSLAYRYKNGIVHKYGKGFLGFREREIKDLLHDRVTLSVNNCNTTYFSLHPVSTVVSDMSGNAISLTNYMMRYDSGTNHVYFRYPSQVVSKDCLTTLTDSIYQLMDSYGNVDLRHHVRGDRTEMTMSSYSAVSSWCSNRLIHTSVIYSSDAGAESGGSRHLSYDNRGNLVREVTDSSSILKLVHAYTYDRFGNCTGESVSGSGQTRTQSVTWSDDGRFPLTSTDELGMVTTSVYNDTTGLLKSRTTAEGTTTYAYDPFGRMIRSTDPYGDVRTTSMEYVNGINGLKYAITETCTHQSPVTTWYSASGQPLYSMKMGFGDNKIFTAMKYNPDGSKQLVSEPFFASSLSDAMSRTFTSQDATLYTYDDYGRIKSIFSPADRVTYTYNGLSTGMNTRSVRTSTRLNSSGLVESKTLLDEDLEPISNPDEPIRNHASHHKSITYAYDPTGRVKTITPQDGGTITLAYDIQGNRTSMTDPDAGTVTDSYNAFGQQISHSQNIHGTGNVVTTYSYSPTDGRLLTETTVGDTTLTKTYTYNNTFKSNLSSVKYDNSNACYYSYDTHGRVSTNYHTINGRTLRNYDYYSGSQHTSHKYGLWAQERYTYDDYGNVIATRYNNSTLWELLEANPRGQIVRERRGGVVTTYTYDNAGRVLSIKAPGIVNLHYTYDEAGNVLSKTDSISTQKVTYTYDGKNRLTDWRVERRLLTPIPMGSKSIHPIIPLDSLFSVTYDEATGNILTKSDLGADAQFTYQSSTGSHALCGVSDVSTDWGNVEQSIAYTDFGKVKSIEEGNNSCHIGYLPDGSRGYTTYADGRTTETRFYGDSFELFRDSLGNSDYIHYLCHGVILYRHGTTMEVLQGYYDAQGSLIALVDADGNVVRRYAYDPWGKRVSPTNWMLEDTTDPDATCHIARGYTMHEHLDNFGLINMNGRVFDPSVAQFLSPDNYIQSDGNWLNYNRYAYCYNNPLSYTDPSGEIVWETIVASMILCGVTDYLTQVAWNMLPILIEGETFDAKKVFYEDIDFFDVGVSCLIGGITGGALPMSDCDGFVGKMGKFILEKEKWIDFLEICGTSLVDWNGGDKSLEIVAFKDFIVRAITQYAVHSVSSYTRDLVYDKYYTQYGDVRSEPQNLAEQLTLQEAKNNVGDVIMKDAIKDPRYTKNWNKMQYIHYDPCGKNNINIHYWENIFSKRKHGFKFKDK